jgi:hypothetical protein
MSWITGIVTCWADLTTLLESPVVAYGAVAVSGGDPTQQHALNDASVKVCEGLRGRDALLRLHHIVWVDHFRLSVTCMPRNLKLFTFSTVALLVDRRMLLMSTISSFVLLRG